MSPKPDSPSPLRSAPERSDPTPELLRSAPERSGAHQYCRSDAPNPTDTYDFSTILCFPHLRSAPTPLRSAPEHINIITPTLQTPLIHVFFPAY